MSEIQLKIQDLLGSSLIIATISTLFVLIIVICLYKMGKIQKDESSAFKLFLLTVFVFGTTWFIADTVISWKKNTNEIPNVDTNVDKFLEDKKISEIEKVQNQNVSKNKSQLQKSNIGDGNNNGNINSNGVSRSNGIYNGRIVNGDRDGNGNRDGNGDGDINANFDAGISSRENIHNQKYESNGYSRNNQHAGSNKIEIDNILREPLTHAPEYRHIAKNKIQIPDKIDIYLDRGNF